MKAKHYSEIAAVVFFAEATFTLIHLLIGAEYRGFGYATSVAVDLGLAVTWFAAGTAVVLRRTFPGFLLVAVGAAMSLIYGGMFSLTEPRSGYGVPFMIESVVLFVMLKAMAPAWDHRRLHHAHPARR